MSTIKWYWLIRFIVGAGLMIALFGVFVMQLGGPSAAMAEIEEEGFDPVSIIVGFVFGFLWDQLFAAGFAGWVVYGNPLHGIPFPPVLYSVEPRDAFR